MAKPMSHRVRKNAAGEEFETAGSAEFPRVRLTLNVKIVS